MDEIIPPSRTSARRRSPSGPGSPAERAGLHSGDLVVALNGVAVRGGTQLRNMIGLARIGEDVELTVDRRGAERKVAVHIDPAGPTPARQRAPNPALRQR
jgi:serine protease Do